MNKSPTVDAEGNFYYEDGELWDPYIGPLHDGDYEPDLERMVAELLLNGELFVNSRRYIEDSLGKDLTKVSAYPTLVLFACISDLDVMEISMKQLPLMYEAWKSDKVYGVAKWAALYRNRRPFIRLEERMKATGVWDEQMEALP